MYVKFENIKFKNILSYGNDETVVNFETGMTLISARSGSGKSTLIDALSFCLYGKPYRKIKINDLINRRNKKKLYTECNFLIGEDRYKIVRTLLPNTIEIYKNDVSSEKLSSKKLNQEEINKIIGIDHNLFRQIIALSINYNKGYLALEAAEKRDIIESIFNIKVFAEMLKKLKNNNANLKVQSQLSLGQISILESTIKTLRTQIDNVEKTRLTFDADKEKTLERLNTEFNNKEIEYKKIIEENKNYKDNITELNSKLSKIDFQSEVSELNSTMKFAEKQFNDASKQIELLELNTTCPFCNSDLTEEHKQKELARLQNDIDKAKKDASDAKERRSSLSQLYTINEGIKKNIATNETSLDKNKTKMSYIKADVKRIVQEIENETNKVFNFDDSQLKKDYEDKKESYKQLFQEYSNVQEDMKYNDFAVNILSDQGIKSFFFRKLVPILNLKINHFLDIFELPVSINFNEVMEEHITNVGGKDDIPYMSFSEGEKKRIDIAIMLSFIDTTKTISNWNCNLLMFDEILDTSIDSEGLDKIMGSIKQMTIDDSKLCSYIISHRDNDHENYNRKMIVKKVGGFSTIG
jgi:DNA repair exonuclease SbcCD ATPase subunit